MTRGMRAVVFAFACLPSVVRAQTYVTTHVLNLRAAASKTSTILETLPQGDTLVRRSDDSPVPGWIPVRSHDGTSGWVSTVFVHKVVVPAPAAATGIAIITDVGGVAFARIDTSWSKPPIGETTIPMQNGHVQCGPTGDEPDDGTNLHKNRADVPATTHLITVDAIRALPDTALWRFTNRHHWTHDDSALVMPYEGIPVTVEGFFEIVKPQSHGTGESPNCHSSDELDTDWHIALVAAPSEHEEQAVVVEPTPRSKRLHHWIATEAEHLAVRRTPSSPRNEAGAARMRVSGFLLLDPVHPTHIRGHCKTDCESKTFFRATLWEVHPVTRIEVFQNGAWVELGAAQPPS